MNQNDEGRNASESPRSQTSSIEDLATTSSRTTFLVPHRIYHPPTHSPLPFAPYTYPACTTCLSKLEASASCWRCKRCQSTYPTSEVGVRWRVRLQGRVQSELSKITLFGPALDRVFGCTAKEFHTRFKARTQNDYVVVEPFGKCAARLAQAFDRLLVGAYLQIAVSEKFIVHDSGDASNAESPRNHQEDGPEQRVDDLTDLIAALNIEAQGGQKGRATHLSGSERRRLRWKLKPDAAISVMEVVGGVPSTIMEELGWEEVKRRTTRKTAIKASPLDDETFESAPGLCLPSRPVENHHDDSASHTSEDLSDWPEELQDVVCDPTVTRCAFVLEEIPWNVLEAEINKQAIEERDEERRSQHVTKPVQNDLQPLPPVSLKSPMLLGLLALAEQGTSQRTPLQSTDTFSTPRDESPQVETQSQMHEISALLQGLDLDDLDDGGYYFTQQQVQASGVNKTVQPADDDEEDDDLIRVLARVCLEDEDDDF